MTTDIVAYPRAFAVWFRDLSRWDASSFHRIKWHWPERVMAPIGSALRLRKERVDKTAFKFSDLQPITIHFDGSVDRRVVDPDREYSMDLWFARPGDIVVAKIDLKNGAVGIVPSDWNNVVVTGHFAVYEPDRSRLLPEYLQLIIQAPFFKAHLWRNKVGAEGRKEVKLDFFEKERIPLPSLVEQKAIIGRWRKSQDQIDSARAQLRSVVETLNQRLWECYRRTSPVDVLAQRCFTVSWQYIEQWDGKSARAVAYRLACPSFIPLSTFAAEATELVRPWEEPDKQWPVFGVDNADGVFFNQHQKGSDFNAPYKRIKRDWFFHNPTRANVGSLGVVPEVPEDAITSPEYQVWRITNDTPPGYVATLINTSFFLRLVDIHRVGAVKQRLYVENLLRIVVPAQPAAYMRNIAERRSQALVAIDRARQEAPKSDLEIEALILGTKTINEE